MADDEEDAPALVTVNAVTSPDPSATLDADTMRRRVPITIITGYLGSGKTTLLNYILKEQHGKKIAVILNEFGDSADIEKALTVNQNGQEVEEWLELANGCICCSVKDSGVNAIEALMDRRGTFDYILLETSGLADPGNIAPLFWVDDGLGSSIYLDGIVTLVDAKNIIRSLGEELTGKEAQASEEDSFHVCSSRTTTAHLQISYADVVILNKSDTVSPAQLDVAQARVQGINSLAKVHVTQYSHMSQLEGVVLDLHAYDGVGSLETSSYGHSHLDPALSTATISLPTLSLKQVENLEAWLRSILWEVKLPLLGHESSSLSKSFSIHRVKGRLILDSGHIKMVQGVREVFEVTDMDRPEAENAEPTGDAPKRVQGKLVLIGRNIFGLPWEESLHSAISGRSS